MSIRSAVLRGFIAGAIITGSASAQSHSTIIGRVTDPSEKAIPGAKIVLRNLATLTERSAVTNAEGLYEVPALSAGSYRMQVRAPGFRLYTVERITAEVARIEVQDVLLKVGDISEEVTVTSQAPLVDSATVSVGAVIDNSTVQELPLNGRHFLDLTVLEPGSVTAPQTAFSAAPTRGVGAQAINTAGNREEAVNYIVNGITLNDLVYSSLLFQPSISAVQEFKIDNSTFGAEYGGSSGAVVNLATRSGTSEFHGEAFEFFRNGVLDSRNFFTLTSMHPPQFQRNQFGGTAGGPILRGKTFFFAYYEGLRQAQGVDLNSLVPSNTERSSASNPIVARLITLIPQPNFVGSGDTARFIGSAPAHVGNDQIGLDISHILAPADRLHAYYSHDGTRTLDPTNFGNTIP